MTYFRFIFHHLPNLFLSLFNDSIKLDLQTVDTFCDLLKNVLVIFFKYLCVLNHDVQIAQKQVRVSIFEFQNCGQSLTIAFSEIIFEEGCKLGNDFLIDFVNEGENVEGVLVLVNVLEFKFILDFIDFILQKHELFQIESEVVISFFVEFANHILKVAFLLDELIFSFPTVLQIDVIVFVLMMNGEPLEKTFIEFFQFSVHLDWVDVVLSIKDNILICWPKLNAFFINYALLQMFNKSVFVAIFMI